MNKKVIKGLKITGSVIFYLIIVVVLLFSIANIRQGDKQKEYPNIFGYGFLTVASDSMNGSQSDSFKKGDLIIVRVANASNIEKLKEGDIVTFYDPNLASSDKMQSALNTHRIVYRNGEYVVTQGDYAVEKYGKFDINNMNNNILIQNYFEEPGLSNIKGIYVSKISGMGNVISHIQNNFFWYIVLPIILFLCFQIFSVTKNILDYRAEKNGTVAITDREQLKADIKAEMEAEKERIRQEILQEMQREKEALKEEPKDEEKKEE